MCFFRPADALTGRNVNVKGEEEQKAVEIAKHCLNKMDGEVCPAFQ